MTMMDDYLKRLFDNLRIQRERAGLSTDEIEDKLILGPGWVRRLEAGEIVPTVDMLLVIIRAIGITLHDLLEGLPPFPDTAKLGRLISAEQRGADVVIHFRYARFDAEYTLENATVDEFETVIKTLRDGLARLTTSDGAIDEAVKTDSVANTFLHAMEVWPHANPSDVWWFIVYRAYCDPFNHPSRFARLDFAQSWKRTGGWALEEILVRHYGPFLKQNGVNLVIADNATKQAIVDTLHVGDRLEPDKIDVIMTAGASESFFGVVHVKASIAERRTDDVPMSRALSSHGYTSPFWTMDCKSVPSESPRNRGEFGVPQNQKGHTSAKRRDIEDEGYFTGCFSYNRNTIPSVETLPAERRIYVCDFGTVDDTFSRFIIERSQAFQSP